MTFFFRLLFALSVVVSCVPYASTRVIQYILGVSGDNGIFDGNYMLYICTGHRYIICLLFFKLYVHCASYNIDYVLSVIY